MTRVGLVVAAVVASAQHSQSVPAKITSLTFRYTQSNKNALVNSLSAENGDWSYTAGVAPPTQVRVPVYMYPSRPPPTYARLPTHLLGVQPGVRCGTCCSRPHP